MCLFVAMDTKFRGAKVHKQATDWLSECNI